MASAYKTFLQSPSAGLLADDASIDYITSTTQITGAQNILKHLQVQQKQVEKKEEKVLNTIESQDGVCFETETTLLFKLGGGVYLPGIDENLLDERTVTFPMIHVVRFDAQQKIQQIRLYWDQGTLLKQVEVIGKTGRNWPIRDGKAQAAAITKSLSSSGQANSVQSLSLRGPNDVVISQHDKRNSVSATRDPHASLALFAPRENEGPRAYDGPKQQQPRQSAKPAPRDYGELFAGDLEPTGASQRSPSPNKAENLVLKGGAGKHHKDVRIFDENEEPHASRSPERKKTFGAKYEHFAFGDGEDAPPQPTRPSSGKSGKGQRQFSFEDFHTPPKVKEKPNRDYERHWGDGVDQVTPPMVKEKHKPDYERHWGAGVDQDTPPSAAPRPVVHAPRPDAEQHFQLTDISPAAGTEKPKSFQRQKGMGLYQDPLHADERAQVNQTNVNNSRRDEDFGAHYSMTDAAPLGEKKIYKTAGDGMGGRKGSGRTWGFGDDSDPDVPDADVRPSARNRRGMQSQAGAEY